MSKFVELEDDEWINLDNVAHIWHEMEEDAYMVRFVGESEPMVVRDLDKMNKLADALGELAGDWCK
jgi:hypothetical protein